MHENKRELIPRQIICTLCVNVDSVAVVLGGSSDIMPREDHDFKLNSRL